MQTKIIAIKCLRTISLNLCIYNVRVYKTYLITTNALSNYKVQKLVIVTFIREELMVDDIESLDDNPVAILPLFSFFITFNHYLSLSHAKIVFAHREELIKFCLLKERN